MWVGSGKSSFSLKGVESGSFWFPKLRVSKSQGVKVQCLIGTRGGVSAPGCTDLGSVGPLARPGGGSGSLALQGSSEGRREGWPPPHQPEKKRSAGGSGPGPQLLLFSELPPCGSSGPAGPAVGRQGHLPHPSALGAEAPPGAQAGATTPTSWP